MKKTYSLFQLSSILLLGCLAFFACKSEETPTPTVSYTVTFNSRGGDAVTPVKVEKGKTISKPTDPKKGDSTLENWYTSPSLTTVFDFSKVITSDTTLYAKWTKEKVTVTFNSRGGTEVASQSITAGQKATKPLTNPTKQPDSIFVDWYADKALTTIFNFDNAVTSDTTIYAKWAKKVTVTFNLRGGTGAVASQTLAMGQKATRPVTNPTKQDSAFDNWYNMDLTTAFNFGNAVTSDTTIYAKWAKKVTVTFNSRGGTGVAQQTLAVGQKVTKPTGDLKKGDSTLENWYTSDLTTVFDFNSAITSDTTIYAKWAKKVTVTFNSRGGTEVASQSISAGQKATRPTTNPTKQPDSTLENWYTSDLTTLFDFNSAITSDTTIYAKWTKKKATVTFNTRGGTEVASQSISAGQKATRPTTNPTKQPDSTLENWYTSDLTTLFDFNSTITSDTTIYAKWTKKKVTVTFNTRGGTEVASQSIDAGQKATRPTTNPTKQPDSTLENWYTSDLTTLFDFNSAITSDTTIYAKWTKKKATVTFNTRGGTEVPSQSIGEGQKATRPTTNPTKQPDSTLENWYTSDLTTVFDFNSAITSDTTIYAKWTKKKATVTFNTRGGTEVPSQSIDAGQKATRPTTNPTKQPDSTLENWYTSDLTTLFDFNSAITSDTTIYAKWTKKVTVTFNTRGGTEVPSQSIDAGQKATRPTTNPTKQPDSTLENWYTSDLTTLFDFNSAITSDATIYAKWVIQTFTVTFDVGATGIGTVPTQTLFKNAKATRPIPTNVPAQKVVIWYRESSFQMAFDFARDTITSSITLYAKLADANIKNIALAGYLPTGDMADDMTQLALQSYVGTGASVVPVYVKVGGTGDGSSWSKAKGNVKTAIDDITDANDTKVYLVLVAGGVYQAGSAMSMKNNVAIIGGWSATGDGSRGLNDTTVLDGNKAYTVINNNNNGLTNKAVLYGVKLANGYTAGYGGGMYNDNSSPAVTNVVFAGNTGGFGGGMYNYLSSPAVTNVVFAGNSASGDGGGMFNDNSSPLLTNVVFSGNSADYGGGMYNSESSPVLTNVVFSGNIASSYGGGMFNFSGSPVVVASILWGNTAPSNTTKQYIDDGATTSVYYSVVQGGSVANNNDTTDPVLNPLTAYSNTSMPYISFSGTSPVNRGLYIRRSKDADKQVTLGISKVNIYTLYYSSDNTTWYDAPELTGTAVTPPAGTVDLTRLDITGYTRTGKPDAGAWEQR